MQTDNTLSDKIILITGASDGIGKATAIDCARQGATVIIHGKTTPKLERLYDEIVDAGYTEPVIYPLDLEKLSPQDCETLNETLGKEFGRLDALFINAGWLGASSPVQQYDTELWHRVMQINLNAAFMLTQSCMPLLNHDDGSSIVFTLDEKSSAYWGAYGVAKAGLMAFMKILADELESSPISVKGLLPGAVKTNLRTRAFPAEDASSLSTPDEVGHASCFLLSPESELIAGEDSHGKIYTLDDILEQLG